MTDDIVINETITEDPNYDGHWRGLAFITHHTYGVQIHQSRGDAERWNDSQARLRPAPGREMFARTVVAGHHQWGTGWNLEDAKARFKREGGRLSDGYVILVFDAATEFRGIDDMGRYHFVGNTPTEAAVKATRKSRR